MGESSLSRLQEPCALFELSLAANSSSSSSSPTESSGASVAAATAGSGAPGGRSGGGAPSSGTEQVAVEFSHSELFDFFLKLEKMQEQLDALS